MNNDLPRLRIVIVLRLPISEGIVPVKEFPASIVIRINFIDSAFPISEGNDPTIWLFPYVNNLVYVGESSIQIKLKQVIWYHIIGQIQSISLRT